MVHMNYFYALKTASMGRIEHKGNVINLLAGTTHNPENSVDLPALNSLFFVFLDKNRKEYHPITCRLLGTYRS